MEFLLILLLNIVIYSLDWTPNLSFVTPFLQMVPSFAHQLRQDLICTSMTAVLASIVVTLFKAFLSAEFLICNSSGRFFTDTVLPALGDILVVCVAARADVARAEDSACFSLSLPKSGCSCISSFTAAISKLHRLFIVRCPVRLSFFSTT